MRGVFFAALCLFCCSAADAVEVRNRKSVSNEPVKITGEWEPGNGVKKLYDTPLGAVYSFHGSAPTLESGFSFWGVQTQSAQGRRRKNAARQSDVAAVAYPLQLKLFRSDTESAKKTRRYLVVEFRLRQFPVEQDPGMELFLFASPDLYGITDLARAIYFISPFFSVKQEAHELDRLIYSRTTFLRFQGSFQRDRKKKIPLRIPDLRSRGPFELFHCRIIFDTSNENSRFCALNLDGETIHVATRGLYDPVPGDTIRSIGFIVSAGRKNSTVWEISAPDVALVEHLEDLENLPALSRESYPYEKYPALPADKLGKSRNPDGLYAQALRLLNGEGKTADFVQGVELLEKAERKNHLPARYLLALCHLRGAGVKKDLRKAENYLKNCVKYRYGKAIATHLMMLQAQKNSSGRSVKSKSPLSEEELAHFHCQMPDGVTSALLQNRKVDFSGSPDVAWNPKLALLAALHGAKNASGLLDYAVKANYPPALAVLAHNAAPGRYGEMIRALEEEKIQAHPMCRLELLRLKTLSGTAVKKDFENQPVELWEHPLFYLLRHAVELPDDAPALRTYLETGHDNVLETLRGRPEYDFLRGCAFLARVMDFRKPDATEKTVNEAVASLKRAASSSPDAAYLLACLYLDGKYVSLNPQPGRQYLDRAATSGRNPAALLRKAKQLMSIGRNAALSLLKKLPSSPEALCLTAELLRAGGNGSSAFRCYQRAAKLEYPEAWLQMGNVFHAGSCGICRSAENALLCWGRFLALERERRENDITDFYWGDSRPPRLPFAARRMTGNSAAQKIFRILRGKVNRPEGNSGTP